MAANKTTSPRKARESTGDEFDFAPGWMPGEGESLLGTVKDRAVGEGEFGSYIVLTLLPDAGQTVHVRLDGNPVEWTTEGDQDDLIAVHCFGTVLDNAVRKMRPAVGARIGFKKLGKRLRKGGDEKNPRDWFNAWAVRDLSVKTDDDIYGKAEPSWSERAGDGTGSFTDEPPF